MNNLVAANSAPKPVSAPRISKRLRQALDLWLTGRAITRKATAEKAGLSYEYFCRCLKKSHIQSFVRERMEQNVADATLRSSSRVIELLDGQSEHVASKVALRMLESDGLIRPAGGPGVSVQINNRASFIVDWHNSRDPSPYSPEELAVIERQGVDPSEYLKSRGKLIDVTQARDVTPEAEESER